MRFDPLALSGVMLLTPQCFQDERGAFMETFRQNLFEQHCGPYTFVQDNHSSSVQGSLRGLHYQRQRPQGKLIRVTQGAIFDVAVDLRQSSATFGHWVGCHLSAENKQMLWIPPGFAHGFYVLSARAESHYKCTDYYDPTDEHILRWNDPTVAIHWPLIAQQAPLLSAKDARGLSLADCPTYSDK